MANSKISALPSASTPLAGTEVFPLVQTGVTVKTTLPACGNPYTGGGQHRRLTIKRTAASGTTTITPNGSNIIDGLSSLALQQNQYASVTLESDGFSSWRIVSFYSPGNQVSASTGVGSVKMGNANPADNAGWLEITPGKYVPYWTDATP
jgi:hypothetical protein